ncbi:Ima1 N-terminal domain-containing protein [Gongronella butleri]|nr:Ima1 N-terminal domain-containing protein [Gongronella butleri]
MLGIRQWIARKIGLDATITVNCWYCNRDTIFTLGGRQTEHYWYCHACENLNALDENGEILDAPLLPSAAARDHLANHGPLARTSARNQLCQRCADNEERIYQYMSDFLPEGNEDDQALAESRAYHRRLQERYPLCADCQRLVQNVIRDEEHFLQNYRINVRREESLAAAVPTKPSKASYWFQALFWCTVHMSVIHMYFALPDVISAAFSWDQIVSRISTCYQIMLIFTAWDLLATFINDWQSDLILTRVASVTFSSSSLVYGYLLLHLVSIAFLDWHPAATKTYWTPSKYQHWTTYKAFQIALYLIRSLFYLSNGYHLDRQAQTCLMLMHCYSLLVLSDKIHDGLSA